MLEKKDFSGFLIPIIYSAAILLIVATQWNQQNAVNHARGSVLYRNLMEQPAFIKRGFNPADIKIGMGGTPSENAANWTRFESTPMRINNSPLEDLPKRTFLSPFGKPEEEFTIAFIINFDDWTYQYLNNTSNVYPGVYLGYIGENWEIFINGNLVKSEMHLDEDGRIKSPRNWRNVYFPLDGSLLVSGENILAFRIVGDPTLGVTGFYYKAPYYIDFYQIIDGRNRYFLHSALCGMFGFIGIYYLIIFFSAGKGKKYYNLYYAIFSFLLCIYSVTRNVYINYLIPNSDISVRMEFVALFLMVPVLGIFIEEMARQRITKTTKIALIIYSIFAVTQIFFCTQYGAEILQIWSISVLIYFSYLFFYDIVYFYISSKKDKHKQASIEEGTSKTFIMNIFIGSILVYLCGIFDVLDTLFFHRAFGLFLYSTFVFHIGISITLAINLQKLNRAMGVFGRFTNKEIAMMAMNEQIKPGGAPKHATIFFSDIRGFTEKSEIFTVKFGEEGSNKIVFWLNDYLSRMVECVEKTGGTIDKFVGDAILAHWGASSTSGNPKQDAYNCVVSSLLMRQELIKMNKERRKESQTDYPEISIGCGINTGIVTAGQIGSEKRMEYTVIGDPVNLASRLESLNKLLGTDILISEYTYNLIKDHVIVEKMPSVRVKGKEKPIRLYTVINLKSSLKGPQTLEEVRKLLHITPPEKLKNELYAR